MTIKVSLLKSGESVIADIQEMVVEERTVGYFFNKPCLVSTKKTVDEDGSFQIKLSPWIPITKQTKIPVINDWVISIVDPIDELLNMYEKNILKK